VIVQRAFAGKGHERRRREGVTKESGEKPQGVKAQEGIEQWAGLNRLSAATDRCSDQRPEGEARGSGTGGATRREENLVKRQEGTTRR
jgi:hypothetical protein